MIGAADTMTAAAQTERKSSAMMHGLPRGAYTERAVLAAEYARVFAPSWCFVGFAHELANPGDARPGHRCRSSHSGCCATRPATSDAFHNVCRHRGHIVVGGPCQDLTALICPYHAWTYDLDGRLKATPHFGGYRVPQVEGLDRADHGLVPVRCAVWCDWIFVNLEGRRGVDRGPSRAADRPARRRRPRRHDAAGQARPRHRQRELEIPGRELC